MQALIIVDVQNDFLPGGALAVPQGDCVLQPIAELLAGQRFDRVLATQDWHPQNHGSFAANHPGTQPGEVIRLAGLEQTLWPVHCVQGSQGAALATALARDKIDSVVRKGTDPQVDSYSGFFDNAKRHKTSLDDELRRLQVTEVFVCGLATDYCVKHTALDANSLGYQTTVLTDACRGMDLRPGDIESTLQALREVGVRCAASRDLQ